MRFDLVLKRPVITEKTYKLSQMGQYTFEVDVKSTKTQIKEVVEKLFKVDVKSMNVVGRLGKVKRFGSKRQEIELSKTKRAIVKLADSQKIDYFAIEENK